MMTVTPIKKLTEANDGSLECQCKGGNESVPTRVACSACGMATQEVFVKNGNAKHGMLSLP